MRRAPTASPRRGGSSSSFKPGGHWTRSLLPSPDGRKLYAGVGSLSNIAESGMAVEEGRAAIYELDLASGSSRIFAGGLRNPVGLAWEPHTGALWTVVNERDGLGDETPPDYLTSVRDGGFYGWPYCYWGQTVDDRVPQDPAAVAKAITPDYALGGHTASLGLCWLPAGTLPGFPDGMAIGQHGSWNRSTLSGYKVVFVPFANGRPAGPPRDILSGFLAPDEQRVLWPAGGRDARPRRLAAGGGRRRRRDLARHRRAAGAELAHGRRNSLPRVHRRQFRNQRLLAGLVEHTGRIERNAAIERDVDLHDGAAPLGRGTRYRWQKIRIASVMTLCTAVCSGGLCFMVACGRLVISA